MVVGINLIALYDEKSDGAFRYIHMLLQEMVNYDLYDTLFVIYKQQNISCDYLNLPSNLKIKYIDVPVLGRGIRRILFEQTVFYRYLVKCDVLYSYCLSMPLFMRCTKIFTLHDLYSYVDKERYGIIRRFYIRTMVKLYVKAANKIITVSEYSKKDIKEYLSVQDEKLSITYNFVNLKYDIQPEVIYTPDNKIVDIEDSFFLYVGSLHNGKNIERMCKAYNLYKKRGGVRKLFIVGKMMENEDSYKELIYNSDGILYLGYQPRSAVDYLQTICYATILVSLYEGFGIPPLEGFMSSKPSIVSSKASLPEVVGEAGVYVDPYNIDDIADAFFNLELNYDRYVSNTQKQLAKFSPKVSVETFMNTLGVKYKYIDK